MVIVLMPGEVLTVQFDDSPTTPIEGIHIDGAFQVHHNSKEYPDSIVVKETGGMQGSIKGQPNEILYHEYFGDLPTVESLKEPDTRTVRIDASRVCPTINKIFPQLGNYVVPRFDYDRGEIMLTLTGNLDKIEGIIASIPKAWLC